MSENGDGDNCPVCLAGMEVPLYVERREDDTAPIVLNGCTRLACGHALHTECLVESLISTQGKCVCCNMRVGLEAQHNTDMPWEQRLKFQQLCLKKLRTVKNTLLVKEGLRDYEAFKKEVREKHKEFKKRLNDHKEVLRKEMKIEELIMTASKLRRDTKRNFMQEMRKSTGIEAAAFSNLSDYAFDRWLFSERGWWIRAVMTRGSRMGFY